MSTFLYFLKIFFPEIDIYQMSFAFSRDQNNIINRDFIYYSFINVITSELFFYSVKKKYAILQSVLDNVLIDKIHLEHILTQFSKAQKYYLRLNNLVYAYRYKRSSVYDTDCDLYMNPLCNFNSSILITIFHDNIKYRFKLSDIISIISQSLSNTNEFFSIPLPIKNPYTNVPFTKSILYTIYFKLKESSYIMPVLFHQFFITEFDLKLFGYYNEGLIRDIAIEKFVRNATCSQKIIYIERLIYKYRHSLAINIHNAFPEVYLVNTFNSYLKDYLYSVYSLNPELKRFSDLKLTLRLKRFTRLNPNYGKREIMLGSSSTSFNSYINTYTPPPTPRNIISENNHSVRVGFTSVTSSITMSESGSEYSATDMEMEPDNSIHNDYFQHVMRLRSVLNELDTSI
jgi:hypothetical protein